MFIRLLLISGLLWLGILTWSGSIATKLWLWHLGKHHHGVLIHHLGDLLLLSTCGSCCTIHIWNLLGLLVHHHHRVHHWVLLLILPRLLGHCHLGTHLLHLHEHLLVHHHLIGHHLLLFKRHWLAWRHHILRVHEWLLHVSSIYVLLWLRMSIHCLVVRHLVEDRLLRNLIGCWCLTFLLLLFFLFMFNFLLILLCFRLWILNFNFILFYLTYNFRFFH